MLKRSFMERAIDLAVSQAQSGAGGPFGAVIEKDGKILAEGASRVPGSLDPTAHAEIIAIRAACQVLGSRDLSECVLYTSCEPCVMCLGAILWAKISRVYYGASRSDATSVGFDDGPLRASLASASIPAATPFIRIMQSESLVAFDAWRSRSENSGGAETSLLQSETREKCSVEAPLMEAH